MAVNFYKDKNGTYWTTTGKKVANLAELTALKKANGKDLTSDSTRASVGPSMSDKGVQPVATAPVDFYKDKNGTYWTTDGRKVSNLAELDALKRAKGKDLTTNSTRAIAGPSTPMANIPTNLEDFSRALASGSAPTQAQLDANAGNWQFGGGPVVSPKSASGASAQVSVAPPSDQLKTYFDGKVASGEIDADSAKLAYELVSKNDFKGLTAPTDAEIEQMLSDQRAIAKQDIDPYYERVKAYDVKDVQDKYADLRNSTLRYQQQEAKSYAETLASTKQKLRAAGLTFSGVGRKTLGKEAAINWKNVEGELPQQRRYNWEDQRAAWQQQARDTGQAMERLYGSEKMAQLFNDDPNNSLVNPYKSGIDYSGKETSPIYLANEKTINGATTNPNYVSIGQRDLDRKKAIEEAAQAAVSRRRLYA